MPRALPGFTSTVFTHGGKARTVYRAGTGPAVIVLAEMPGITPRVTHFAERLSGLGFTAVMPHLFGTPGKSPSNARFVRSMLQACISREFTIFARGKNSPITDWLRALARHEHETCGGPGVGVVGMCFTGGFALGMMVDETVIAPVLSQPSLPLGKKPETRADLGIDAVTLDRVKERCRTENLCVLGLRFEKDELAPYERFVRLGEELGRHFVGVEIPSAPGNPDGINVKAHSVLTEHLVDRPDHPTHKALQQVIDLFQDRLLRSDQTR
jgi:dienelactone hydrolase